MSEILGEDLRWGLRNKLWGQIWQNLDDQIWDQPVWKIKPKLELQLWEQIQWQLQWQLRIKIDEDLCRRY